MTWVRLVSVQEAIIEVDLPLAAGEAALREAALCRLDESGGAEWDSIGGEIEASADPIPSESERLAAWRAKATRPRGVRRERAQERRAGAGRER